MALIDFNIVEGLSKLKMPLGIIALCGALGYGTFDAMGRTFVKVSEFHQYQSSIEMRILEAERRRLELETLRLQTKRNAYPKLFDAVDQAVLTRQEYNLTETVAEISKLRQEERVHR